jgi:hypothetical protein
VEGAGELIRHEPVEHGVIYSAAGKALYYVRSRPGSPYRVTVPPGKAGLLPRNVFVHNHPGSESFSEEDIWILLRHGAREVHAYGPERSFRIVATKRTRRFVYSSEERGRSELYAAYRRAVAATTPLFHDLVASDILTEPEGWVAQTHGVVRVLSARFGFAYMEI